MLDRRARRVPPPRRSPKFRKRNTIASWRHQGLQIGVTGNGHTLRRSIKGVAVHVPNKTRTHLLRRVAFSSETPLADLAVPQESRRRTAWRKTSGILNKRNAASSIYTSALGNGFGVETVVLGMMACRLDHFSFENNSKRTKTKRGINTRKMKRRTLAFHPLVAVLYRSQLPIPTFLFSFWFIWNVIDEYLNENCMTSVCRCFRGGCVVHCRCYRGLLFF